MEKNLFGIQLPSQQEILNIEIDQTLSKPVENMHWPRRICNYMDSSDSCPIMNSVFKESVLIKVSH